MTADTIKLRLLKNTDIPLVESWLNKAHIKKWYDIPPVCAVDDWLTEIKNRETEFAFITHLMAIYEETPIGFCQYYPCASALEDWYGQIPLTGTYSIDYLIGEQHFLGKGLGKAIIASLAAEMFAQKGCGRIIVQPDEKNQASCHALLSAGSCLDEANHVYLLTK